MSETTIATNEQCRLKSTNPDEKLPKITAVVSYDIGSSYRSNVVLAPSRFRPTRIKPLRQQSLLFAREQNERTIYLAANVYRTNKSLPLLVNYKYRSPVYHFRSYKHFVIFDERFHYFIVGVSFTTRVCNYVSIVFRFVNAF